MKKTNRTTKTTKTAAIIGTTATFIGTTEHQYMKGGKVQVLGILRGTTEADFDHIRTNDDLAKKGGLLDTDRVEVAPWIEKEGRFSWVTSDPKATDLRF